MLYLLSFSIDIGDVIFFLLIGSMILFKVLKNKKTDTSEITKISAINSINAGAVKIKGRLQKINLIKAPISNSDCIGYSHHQLSYGYKVGKKAKGSKKWRTFRSESKSADFYIEDPTGKIKVNAKNIIIQINVNKSEEKLSRNLLNVENVLLEDDTEYIVTGTAINKNGTMQIIKGTTDKELRIMDKAFYDFTFEDVPLMKKKMSFFIVFLIVSILCFIIYKFIF